MTAGVIMASIAASDRGGLADSSVISRMQRFLLTGDVAMRVVAGAPGMPRRGISGAPGAPERGASGGGGSGDAERWHQRFLSDVRRSGG